MKKFLWAALALLAIGAVPAYAAKDVQFTIPSFTLTGPPATLVTCTPTAASSGQAALAPAGTVMFTCVVAPTNWQGGVSITDAALTVTGLSGNAFSLSLVAAGVAQTYPAGTGSVLP